MLQLREPRQEILSWLRPLKTVQPENTTECSKVTVAQFMFFEKKMAFITAVRFEPGAFE